MYLCCAYAHQFECHCLLYGAAAYITRVYRSTSICRHTNDDHWHLVTVTVGSPRRKEDRHTTGVYLKVYVHSNDKKMSSSIRCVATSARTGARCRNKTRMRFPKCWQHTRSQDGVAVKDSTIPGAGKGLFATKDYRKNETIMQYKGPIKWLDKDEEEKTSNRYLLLANNMKAKRNGKRAFVDGQDPSNSTVVRYANTKTTKRDNNTYFAHNNNPRYGPFPRVRTTKNVHKGREIFTDYGKSYRRAIAWNRRHGSKASKAPRRRRR